MPEVRQPVAPIPLHCKANACSCRTRVSRSVKDSTPIMPRSSVRRVMVARSATLRRAAASHELELCLSLPAVEMSFQSSDGSLRHIPPKLDSSRRIEAIWGHLHHP